VSENSAKSPAATAWENGAFNPGRAKGEVPALKFDNPNPRGNDFVRFDGIDPANPKILIDRKIAATTGKRKRANANANANGTGLNIELAPPHFPPPGYI
jgi:hypothetical protein